MLSVEHISYTYRSKYQMVYALRDVSCRFEAGQFHVIEGRSGSGKSTLLSLLAGLDAPDSGDILLEGASYTKLDKTLLRRNRVSVIFQAFNLFPLLTVRENVMYPMELESRARGARQRAGELIRSVGLEDAVLDKYPAMLSGGEQQRVAIARALASKAKIILADEPTGNLDSENGALVVEILRGLVSQEGHCVILVTHDDGIAQQADVLFHMQDGTILGRNTADKDRQAPPC